MKQFFLFVIMLQLAGCKLSREAISKQLIEMELDRSKAIAARDTVTLDKMYTDDFKGVTAIGFPVTKPILMEVFKRDNPDVIFTNSGHEARVLNKKTAVLTGKILGKTRDGNTVHESLYMHVLTRKNGRWQITAAQGTGTLKQ